MTWTHATFRALGIFASLAATHLAAVSCAPRAATPVADETRTNEIVARRVLDEILSQGRYASARELYDPAFVNHGRHADVGLARDQAAAKGWRDATRTCPCTSIRSWHKGDLVSVLWTAKGTTTGTGNGLPATGRRAEGRGRTLWRLRNGPITEEWSEFDEADIARQLGLAGGP